MMLEQMGGEVYSLPCTLTYYVHLTSILQPSPTILERLQVSLAFDIEAVHEVLETLRQTQSARSSYSELPTTRCIVIDSITPLLGPMLSATSSQGVLGQPKRMKYRSPWS